MLRSDLVRLLVFRQGSITGAIRDRGITGDRGKEVCITIQLYTHTVTASSRYNDPMVG